MLNSAQTLSFGNASPFLAWLRIVCLVLPWVQPWSPSPQPNTVPLLISWACIGLLMVGGPRIPALDMARAWAWAALISSVMGLIQYAGADAAFSPWLHVTGVVGEASANLRQRNQLATLLSMGMLSVLWWQAHGLKTGHALWMLALLAVGNAATASRTGLLHMLLVLGLVAIWSFRSRGTPQRLSLGLMVWAVAIYLLANGALPWWLSTFSGQDLSGALARMGEDEGCGSRRVLWGNVLQLIGQKPWWGWGWGELKYAHYITPYPGGPADRFCAILGHAHNLPLHLAVTLGVPIAALLSLGVMALLAWARPWRSHLPNAQLAWSVLAVIGLHSLLEFPLWYGPFQMAVLLCVLLLVPPRFSLKTYGPQMTRLTGVLLLTVVCMVGADYLRARQIYLPAHQRIALWRNHPLAAAHSSWFFGRSATFAELSMTRVTPDNAAWVLATSLDMLHYSPEPMVLRQLIKSAHMLGQQPLVDEHMARWRAAFPTEAVPTL